jgi:hypothetical protein
MPRPAAHPSPLVPVALAALAACATFAVPRAAQAQLTPAAPAAAPARDDGPVCLGFAFGAWTPKLDWRAVGHVVAPERGAHDAAPSGRDWAAPPVEGDTLLLLLPRWWPAGVTVALPTRTPAAGDTIVGRAVALVPRGDIAAPETQVRAWRVPCRGATSR